MKKIKFENLPSTKTPLSAENLNQIQDNIEESSVYVGVQEPTNEKVWFKSSKNLVNIKNFVGFGGNTTSNITDNSIQTSGKWGITQTINIQKGTYYINWELQKIEGTNSHNVVTLLNEDGDLITSILPNSIITIDKNCKQIQLNTSYGTTSGTFKISNFILEKTNKNSNYEPYKNDEILLKKDNSFIPFLSKSIKSFYSNYTSKKETIYLPNGDNQIYLLVAGTSANNMSSMSLIYYCEGTLYHRDIISHEAIEITYEKNSFTIKPTYTTTYSVITLKE